MNLIKQLPSLNVQGYILTNSNKYMEPRAIRKYYNNFLLKLGIQPINFHCLRHTFATRCIEAGIPPVVLKNWLGHKNIHITLDTYADVFDRMNFNAVEKLEDYIGTFEAGNREAVI